jgi:pyruvate dehydrogenase E1 component alpha subunit
MGGSMHFADITKNFWGGYAIVGSHLLLAVGVALACQMQKTNGVVMVFFGDGATNGGEFYESLNFAQLWKLPVVFVCENNLYAMGTPIEVHSSVKEIYRKASAFDMKAMRIDGNDVLTVREQVGEAVEYARSGERRAGRSHDLSLPWALGARHPKISLQRRCRATSLE